MWLSCGCDNINITDYYSGDSCQWVTVCCCCGVRTSTILICSLYILLQAAFLALTILFRSNTEESLENFLKIVDTEDSRLENSYFYTSVRSYIVQVFNTIVSERLLTIIS